VAGGTLSLRTMWSIEPYMGAEGYPLLLQTGETADGVSPLVDRQHPHDFPMEIAITYSRALADERTLYVYLAAVGAPALGPPPFMHRESSGGLPISPITHHWFDSTHITFGVVTAGFVSSPRVKFEASLFRGREPDPDRWNLEQPGFDSFAARLSINPTEHLAIQMSGGALRNPEQLHPAADVGRLTVSAMYTRQWKNWTLASTAAWGRNSRSVSTLEVPGGFLVFPASVARAALGEATLRWKRLGVVGRGERAGKDELFAITDPRHGVVYQVARTTAGAIVDLIKRERFVVTLGGALSWLQADAAIAGEYGRPAASRLAFAGLTLR
jgi:hypothetical protein